MEDAALITVLFVTEDTKLETVTLKGVSHTNLNPVLVYEACLKLKVCCVTGVCLMLLDTKQCFPCVAEFER